MRALCCMTHSCSCNVGIGKRMDQPNPNAPHPVNQYITSIPKFSNYSTQKYLIIEQNFTAMQMWRNIYVKLQQMPTNNLTFYIYVNNSVQICSLTAFYRTDIV